MQAVFENIRKIYSEMNKISFYYIKYGNILVFTVAVLVIFCLVSAGRFGNYDYLFYMKNELLICLRELMGAIYVPALFIEIIHLAEKSENR